MAVLDHSKPAKVHAFDWRRLPPAIILGVTAGFGAGYLAYEPLLRLLARGKQLWVTDPRDLFFSWLRFMALFGVAGLLVSCGSALPGSAGRCVMKRAVAFAGLLIVGIAVGLFGIRIYWNPSGVDYVPFASVPMLFAPVTGCVSVLLGICVAAGRRVLLAQIIHGSFETTASFKR